MSQYSSTPITVVNGIFRTCVARRARWFDIRFTKNNEALLRFFRVNGLLFKVLLLNTRRGATLRCFINYFNGLNATRCFYPSVRATHRVFISCKALRALRQRGGASVFLLSTSRGLTDHLSALGKNTGGCFYGFFSL